MTKPIPKPRTCASCHRAFLSKYALKTHVCGSGAGYASADEALAEIRARRRGDTR